MTPFADHPYLKKLENIHFQPVFIQGLHRSGTSILYKMLSETKCFNPVTAYHLIKYDQLLNDFVNHRVDDVKQQLTISFRKKGVKDRGIDRLKINADFAEEYGFLLGNKTGKVYLAANTIPVFTELCQKIQYTAQNTKPILLKNPYDFANSTYIKTIFPTAKFIFIHRHPYKSLSSLIKAVRLLMDEENPYASHLFKLYNTLFENPLLLYGIRSLVSYFPPLGLMILTYYAAGLTRKYLKTIPNLSREDYISLTYEDLCTNPQKHMDRIITKLDIHPEIPLDFSQYIRPRKTTLDPSVIQLRGFIYKRMKPYFHHLGYHPDAYLTD
jgi:hypothetical protein